MSVKYPLAAAEIDVLRHLASIKNKEVADSIAPISDDPAILGRHIKRLGYFLKADIVGICQLPEYAFYSHDRAGNPINTSYQFAIVIVMRKEYRTVKASTGHDWIGDAISFQCYQHLALVSETMADYIRRLGYPASAEYTLKSGGFHVIIPPLLLWSGIGEESRVGIILNPFLGLNYKAAAVLTNLPLLPDKPIDFGLQDFCQRCRICALSCPTRAIPTGDKIMHNGYESWKLDEQRCTTFSMLNKTGTICNNCIRVCPWTKPYTWQHNFVRWAVRHSSLASLAAIKAETILGYGKPVKREKWWFDLEEVDGFLRIPPARKKIMH